MGLSKYIQNKLKEKVVNYKAERAHNKEERLTERNEYERGRHEGAYKRGQTEGAGGLTESEKFYAKQNRGGGRVQRTTGRGGFSGVAKRSNDVFDWTGGGGFGLGGSGDSRPRPTRVITKANGKVTIAEYGNRESDEGMGSLGLGSGIGIEGFSGPRKKGEKHPYDIF